MDKRKSDYLREVESGSSHEEDTIGTLLRVSVMDPLISSARLGVSLFQVVVITVLGQVVSGLDYNHWVTPSDRPFAVAFAEKYNLVLVPNDCIVRRVTTEYGDCICMVLVVQPGQFGITDTLPESIRDVQPLKSMLDCYRSFAPLMTLSNRVGISPDLSQEATEMDGECSLVAACPSCIVDDSQPERPEEWAVDHQIHTNPPRSPLSYQSLDGEDDGVKRRRVIKGRERLDPSLPSQED